MSSLLQMRERESNRSRLVYQFALCLAEKKRQRSARVVARTPASTAFTSPYASPSFLEASSHEQPSALTMVPTAPWPSFGASCTHPLDSSPTRIGTPLLGLGMAVGRADHLRLSEWWLACMHACTTSQSISLLQIDMTTSTRGRGSAH